MSSSHESPSSRSRPNPRATVSLEALLEQALRPDVMPGGLEDRIMRRTGEDLRMEGEADRRLARRLEAELVPPHVVPADLEPRVHAASVGGLRSVDAPLEFAAERRERAVVGRIGRARTVAGRLAMAASFGVLAFAGWWTTRPDAAAPGIAPVDRVLAANVTDLDDLSWASLEDSNAVEAELALLESWDVGSYADVAGEIEAIIPDFMMADLRP